MVYSKMKQTLGHALIINSSIDIPVFFTISISSSL